MSESKYLERIRYNLIWCLRNWKKGSIQNEKLKCSLSRDCVLHMLFKLGQCSEKREKRRKSLLGFDYLAKLIEGIQFSDGIEVIPEIQIAA